MMGECLKEIRDYDGASRHFDDTTSRMHLQASGPRKLLIKPYSVTKRLGSRIKLTVWKSEGMTG